MLWIPDASSKHRLDSNHLDAAFLLMLTVSDCHRFHSLHLSHSAMTPSFSVAVQVHPCIWHCYCIRIDGYRGSCNYTPSPSSSPLRSLRKYAVVVTLMTVSARCFAITPNFFFLACLAGLFFFFRKGAEGKISHERLEKLKGCALALPHRGYSLSPLHLGGRWFFHPSDCGAYTSFDIPISTAISPKCSKRRGHKKPRCRARMIQSSQHGKGRRSLFALTADGSRVKRKSGAPANPSIKFIVQYHSETRNAG